MMRNKEKSEKVEKFNNWDMTAKWQSALFKVNLVLAILSIATEVIVSLNLYYQNLIVEDLRTYLILYLFLPAAITLGAVLVMYMAFALTRSSTGANAYDVTKTGKVSSDIRSVSVVICLFVLCFNVAYTHYVFSVTIALLCVPIFVSVVFFNEKLSKSTLIICEIGVIMVAIHRYVERHGEDSLIVPDITIAIVIVGVAGYITLVMGRIMKAQSLEIVRAKELAEEANVIKSDFLARMSHEIRTPINAVIGMDEMILRESNEPSVCEYAADIMSASTSLLGIINDILDISKIEAGKMELTYAEYDTAVLLRDIYTNVSIKASEKGLRLIFDIANNLPAKMYGDDLRLKQIITNILNNAVKYTQIGSVTLKITGKMNGDKEVLSISVKDTGIGIREEDIPKIKEKFQRVDEDRNRKIEGTGLGINISLELLQLMNSHLEVESQYGVGSDFFFDIEQGIVDPAPLGDFKTIYKREVAFRQEHENWQSEGTRVLVVDDSEINLKVFSNLLKNHGLIIDTAKSGIEGLNMVSATTYDIIFLDHMMPGMDGIETFHQMKESGFNPDTPVIVLTANAIVGAREEYMKEGFSDYLSKPINPNSLDDMLRRYILHA